MGCAEQSVLPLSLASLVFVLPFSMPNVASETRIKHSVLLYDQPHASQRQRTSAPTNRVP